MDEGVFIGKIVLRELKFRDILSQRKKEQFLGDECEARFALQRRVWLRMEIGDAAGGDNRGGVGGEWGLGGNLGVWEWRGR